MTGQRGVTQRFGDASEKTATLIENKINEELIFFKRTTAFFSDFDSIYEVDHKKFIDFAYKALGVQPVLLAVEWAPRVLREQRVQFEKKARELSPGFSIVVKEADGRSIPVADQDEYYPIYFIEPLKGHEAAVGFDIASDKERMMIMQKTADENRAIISAPIDIVYKNDKQQGFLAYLPVYKQGRVFGMARDRREAIQGFLLGFFRSADLIYNIKSIKSNHLEIAIADVTESDNPQHLYSSIKISDEKKMTYVDVRTIGARSWQITCVAEDGYYVLSYGILAFVVLFISIILTLAYAFSMWHEASKSKVAVDEMLVHKGNVEKLQKENEKIVLAGNEFFDTISYKMRIPLTSIVGNVELLLESTIDEEQKKEVQQIMRSAESLLGVANDVFDIANIETEQVELAIDYFNLEEMIKNLLSTTVLTTRKKKVSFDSHYEMHIPHTVLGDESRIRQILSGIIKNAEFFIEDGKVEINVVAEKVNKHYNYSIAVSDTGAGISKEDLPKIFDRFFHSENNKKTTERGLGLGLHLCQKLAQAMGGGITVKSKEGEGSTFTLALPFKIAEEDKGVVVAEEDEEKAEFSVVSTKMEGVLVVDDSAFNSKIVAKMLRKIVNCDVVECGSGAKTLELIKQKHFDVIFMDCQMPEMDGYQTSQNIREYEKSSEGKPAVIVALTGHVLKGEREKCLASGMNDYLVKPVKLDTLWQVMKKWALKDKVDSTKEDAQT
ncbi:MAG: response regulator [Waddliaceae bacterium]|nr:response regulator [Waddliaceae bacterium]